MKSLGVDDVYCLSVNDAFVMRQVRNYLFYFEITINSLICILLH